MPIVVHPGTARPVARIDPGVPDGNVRRCMTRPRLFLDIADATHRRMRYESVPSMQNRQHRQPVFSAIDPIATRMHTLACRLRFAYGIVPTSITMAHSMGSGALVVVR